ncbi:Rieske (2Fe-2S) protein [Apibacter raozihei]|uniref:QcrA and Rieske domain-containing protein n=1 Tax=Apibacter TaxID=1778601 RepID=UPI000FE33E3F|nr:MULTISPECIES: Rieske (2Fe-2S) protein [Apibacter]
MSKDNKTPVWKSDFPVKQDESVHVSRREFAKFLCLLSGSLALGNGAIAAKSLFFPKDKVNEEYFVCNSSEVPIGKMKAFVINDNHKIPYILIHLGEDKWRCFEQKCTHLSCAVLYRHDLKKIECPCHKGFFDPETGEVLQGPPPRPLPQLSVVIRDGKVFVTEKEIA